ncbi:RNA polymerase sigma factor [Arcticibacter svalbardensis]|nr:sigma-70 family RNA polymerase sigma factor [Arcticibacter svalbardensis]
MKEQFSLLIANHQGLIFKVCNMYCNNKEDKEDLFQDIVLQLWRSFPSFKGDAKVSTWMYRIAINNAITRLRKETKREKFSGLNDEAFEVMVEENAIDEKALMMYEAIKKLTEVERALSMLYLDNCSYKEIAEVMGLSETNVGFKLNKIKAKLRSLVIIV